MRRLQDGVVLRNRWEITGQLGRGAFGEAYRARDLEGVLGEIALKLIPCRDPKNLRIERKEAQALGAISHQNIVAYRDSFQLELAGTTCFVVGMELCASTLANEALRLGRRDRIDALLRIAMPQVLTGLVALHSRFRRVHRDLHAGNVLCDRESHWKIGDLGLAREINEGGFYVGPIGGDWRHCAPEIVGGDRTHVGTDVYALGVVVHWLLTHQFLHPDERALRTQAPRISEQLPAPWIEFVRACSAASSDRPSAQDLSALVPEAVDEAQPIGIPRTADLPLPPDALINRVIYKIAQDGRAFRVVLRPDGTAEESSLFRPEDTWDARWNLDETGRLSISVGPYVLLTASSLTEGADLMEAVERKEGRVEPGRFLVAFGDSVPQLPAVGDQYLKISESGRLFAIALHGEAGARFGSLTECDPRAPGMSWAGDWQTHPRNQSDSTFEISVGPYSLRLARSGTEWSGVEWHGADPGSSFRVVRIRRVSVVS